MKNKKQNKKEVKKKSQGSTWSSYKNKMPHKMITEEEITTMDKKTSDSKSKEKYLIWHVQGGLGKNVAATSLVSHLRTKYIDRKIIIVASWPEVWMNHPMVDRLFHLGNTPHFYDDYIHNKDSIVFKHEAYNQTAHLNHSQHLIHNWCDLMDLEYEDNEKFHPKVILNYAQQQLTQRWIRQKPTMVLHTNGGPMEQKFSYNWSRDLPPELSQEIVNAFADRFHIFHVCRKDSSILQGVERIDEPMGNIELFSILATSTSRVLIDSCLQHAAVAFQLPSTVLWIGTSPKVFGYDFHNNVLAKNPVVANQRLNSYMFDYDFSSNLHECPYTTFTEIFEPQIVIRNIENQLNM